MMNDVSSQKLSSSRSNSGDRGRMFWIHALEPLHIGAGRGIGFIDLPIMREKTTNWPIAPGSGIKGVLADVFRADKDGRDDANQNLGLGFGRGGDDNANAGKLMLTDARLIAFPVRSLYGTFAWVTCSLALSRLHRDLQLQGLGRGLMATLKQPQNGAHNALGLCVADSAKTKLQSGGSAFVGELDFAVSQETELDAWASFIGAQAIEHADWRICFAERFCLVADEVFTWLTEFESQVDARVKINDQTKTVDNGQLWYEESLPPEAILAGHVTCDRILPSERRSVNETQLLDEFCRTPQTLQMGGKASVGRGIVSLRFSQPSPTGREN